MANWKPKTFKPDSFTPDPAEPATDAPAESGLVQRLAAIGDAEGKAEAFGRGAVQGATLGLGDESTGLFQALADRFPSMRLNPLAFAAHLTSGRPVSEFFTDYLDEQEKRNAGRGQSFLDSYRQQRDDVRRGNEASEKAHGGMYLGGNLFGGAITAPLMGGSGAGKTLGQLMLQGAKVGAATGAAYGFGSSKADLTSGRLEDWLQAAGDTALGGAGGAALGVAAPPVVSALGYVGRNVVSPALKYLRGGFIEPTPAAQRLMSQGAELSLGQMRPDSTFGRVEELAASAPGTPLSAVREKSAGSVRDLLLKAASAPGAKAPVAGAPVADQLEQLRAGFGQIYNQALDGAMLEPEKYLGSGKWRGLLTDPEMVGTAKTKGAFELAAGAKDIDASPDVRARALDWLTDKAQQLVPIKSGPNAGKVEARSIQALRTQLRDKLRSLGAEGDDRSLREIYGRAEEFVSELLEGQLPPDRAAMLKGADATYKNLLAVQDAANGRAFAGQDQEFTPTQLLQAIRTRGSTPALESVARDAQSVLAARYPPTGLQQAALSSVPGLKWIGPIGTTAFNTSPALKQHALRPLWQAGLPAKTLAALGQAIEGAGKSPRVTSTAARTLLDLLTPPAPPVSSLAQGEDDPPAWALAP